MCEGIRGRIWFLIESYKATSQFDKFPIFSSFDEAER
jgi:hypothetical protein